MSEIKRGGFFFNTLYNLMGFDTIEIDLVLNHLFVVHQIHIFSTSVWLYYRNDITSWGRTEPSSGTDWDLAFLCLDLVA